MTSATGTFVDIISQLGEVLPLMIGYLTDRAGLTAAMAAFVGLAALLVVAANGIGRWKSPP